MAHDISSGFAVEGRRIRAMETGGWRTSRNLFARRGDGTIVRVIARAHVVVDRHVRGGCLGCAGGRGWFEDVVYEMRAVRASEAR